MQEMNSKLPILILVVAFAVCGVPAETPPAEEPDGVRLPLTIERVWFKPSRKLISSGGDLTISEEGLELVKNKKTVLIPLEELYVLSYGRFKSDVDTEWSILGIGENGPSTLLAIRDGKKLGYGRRTKKIYEQLRQAMKKLGVAQFQVPPGYVIFEAFANQFTLAIPEGWDTHLQSLVVEADGHSWGTAIFSSENIEHTYATAGEISHLEDDPDLRRVLTGEVPAFFVARDEVDSGMGCNGFTDKAKQKLIRREHERTVDVLGYPLVEPFSVTPATVAFCSGFRAQGRSRRPDGREIQIDLYIVADGSTLYVLGMRALDDLPASAREPFENALATLKFSVAR